tara:strand:- start:3 stop:446 length:444 start_codon:yes stop_codon:yes gene_type:complete
MSRTISFRGLINDGGIDTIPLQTNNGLTGYQITKFEIMDNLPGQQDVNHIIQIFKTEQATASATVDFSDNRLLGAAMERESVGAEDMAVSKSVIFDSEKFNQDIYITHVETTSNKSANYYIELKQMKLDLSEQSVATLKNIRNTGSQ